MSDFGQTIKAVGQCFAVRSSRDVRMVLFLLSKSWAVPVLRMMADS